MLFTCLCAPVGGGVGTDVVAVGGGVSTDVVAGILLVPLPWKSLTVTAAAPCISHHHPAQPAPVRALPATTRYVLRTPLFCSHFMCACRVPTEIR